MDKEEYFDDKHIKGKYQQAIAPDTAKALMSFCEQEAEFEQASSSQARHFRNALTA